MEFLNCMLLLSGILLQTSYAANPNRIVETAKGFIGSQRWLWDAQLERTAGPKTDKCHLFVGYVLRKAGAPAPNRKFIRYSPIGVAEWENPTHKKRCWQNCVDQPRLGDVIAFNGHVGIVTGRKLTTSSSLEVTPPGWIVENDWGFRAGQTPVCWRYKYNTPWCYYFR